MDTQMQTQRTPQKERTLAPVSICPRSYILSVVLIWLRVSLQVALQRKKKMEPRKTILKSEMLYDRLVEVLRIYLIKYEETAAKGVKEAHQEWLSPEKVIIEISQWTATALYYLQL